MTDPRDVAERNAREDARAGIENADTVHVECDDCGSPFEINEWVAAQPGPKRCETCRH